MSTNTIWTWTILMAGGESFQVKKSISLTDLLNRYRDAGYHQTQIEAIIRH